MSFQVTVRAETNFLLGQRSLAALLDDSFERGELVQVQDIEALVSYWILQLQFEQHTTGSQNSPALAAASPCGFPEVLLLCCLQLSMVSHVRQFSCMHLR